MPDDPELAALKLPPHSIEAEQSVLGGLMLDNDAADRIGDVVGPEDFYADAHRIVYAAATRLIAEGRPADVVTVAEALDSTQKLDYVGGLDYLGALVQNVPTAANIRHYAMIVRERSILRQLAATAGEIADAAYHPLGRSAREVLDIAEAKVLHIAEQGSRGQQNYVEIGRLLASVVERIEDLYNRDDPSDVTGIATGYADLDRETAGLQPGDLVIVAGRPSMGKAQPLDARVLARHGWKAMGALAVGDALASVDGKASIVCGVYPQGERDIYRVAFADGRFARVCDEHLWRVHHEHWAAPRVLTTARVRRMLDEPRYRGRLSIELSGGHWGHEDPLPMDPWLVGALLEERGRFRCSSFDGASATRELLDRVRAGIGRASLASSRASGHAQLHAQCVADEATDAAATVSPRRTAQPPARSIPACYMNAQRAARLDLLRGILDTGARVARTGRIRYATTNSHLAHQVVDLVRSLGGACSVRLAGSDVVAAEAEAGVHVLTIDHPDPRSLFLFHARAMHARARRGAVATLAFTSILPMGRAPAQCIAVSHPSRLYVTDGHVVTHNTAFALNVGEHVALNLKLPVAVFSMEMGATQLAMRLIGSVGRLPAQHLRTGRLQPDDWEKLSAALGRLNEAQILIDETPSLTAIEVRSRARRMMKQYGKLGLVIVDYLQLMQASSSGENRATEISEISRSMKALAKELKVPVMALSQLNRSLEQRPNKRPVMSDLRESGAIEQDADVILFIYRDEVYNPDTQDKGVAEIIIGKQRNGPIGTVRLTFLGEYTRFENFAQRGSY